MPILDGSGQVWVEKFAAVGLRPAYKEGSDLLERKQSWRPNAPISVFDHDSFITLYPAGLFRRITCGVEPENCPVIGASCAENCPVIRLSCAQNCPIIGAARTPACALTCSFGTCMRNSSASHEGRRQTGMYRCEGQQRQGDVAGGMRSVAMCRCSVRGV
jgi:UDP-3-O-acyl N-acetylglycosamine deacetylase